MLRAGFGGDGGFGLRLVWGRKKEGPGWRERLGAGERARVWWTKVGGRRGFGWFLKIRADSDRGRMLRRGDDLWLLGCGRLVVCGSLLETGVVGFVVCVEECGFGE